MVNGGDMYRTVFEYASLGEHHRTGTPEDAATLDWFEAKLARLGAHTERVPWSFDRYDAEWSLTADGEEIEALPLYYLGAGDVETADPALIESAALPGSAEFALRDGAAASIVFSSNAAGDLQAINRAPGEGIGLLALCVGSNARPALETGPVRMRMSARTVPATSASITGRIGDGPDSSRLMLTTPLSGWFRCAGERGTGIAVMLAVAETLAARGVPLLLNANSGHELEDFGAHRYVEMQPEARAVFHFGASVAAGDPDFRGRLRLSKGVRVRASVPGGDQALVKAFKPLGTQIDFVPTESREDPSRWVGEARVWCRLAMPLVSVAGPSSLFHTKDDLPARATNPGLLEESYAAVLDACDILSHV